MSGPDQPFTKPRARLARAWLWVQMLILLVRFENDANPHGARPRPASPSAAGQTMNRLTGESPERGVVDDRHTHARARVRRGGVVWLAYAPRRGT